MVSDFQPHESYQFFLQEALELLQSLEEGLLGLRQNLSLTNLNNLMRTAHSIKGGAACVGLTHIQTLAHHLETIFKTLIEADIPIDLELENLLLSAYDCLRSPLLEEIQTGESDVEIALMNIEPILAQFEINLKTTGKKKSDVTEFLFAEEVAQGLNRLETILANPNAPEMLEALKAQAEIFRGLGELSHLPGFVTIAQTTLMALQNYPDNAVKIGQWALEDFRNAQVLILAGNRHLIGKPSPRLIQLATPVEVEVEAPSSPTTPTPPTPTPPSLPLGVRLDLERLEVLNNLVGELVTQDNSHLLHNQQHEETLETLTQWLNRFQGLSQDLQSQINQLTTEAKLVTAEKPDGLEVKDFTNLFSRTKSSPSQIQSTMETVMEELVQIEERVQDLNLLNQKFKQLLKQRQRTLKQVQSNLLQGRMLPVGELLKQFPRMVRDLTTQEHKQVTLQLNGTNTLIDKVILEKLYDPLVHLIRNAFDHGIEPPEVRVHQGKSPQGNITLSTYHRGNQIYIEVQDDGQGINLEKIRNQAVAMNWLLPVEAGTVSKNRLYEYLFASGFSTAEQVSQLSGRGMGLSAVRSQIDALKGIVSIASETGKGTTFTLRLPLTLTIVKLLVFSLNSHLFALPVDTIDSIVVVDEAKLETNQGQQFYQSSAQQIPLYPYALLSSYYYPQIVNASKPLPGQYWQKSGKVTLLLISSGTQVIALKVDQILMEQDLVIKPFNEAIPTPASLCGCTILGDGRLIPVLEGAGLVEKWLQLADSAFNLSIASIPLVFPPVPTILVVDDSLTIRQTLSMTLQKASYRVIQARDGWEALEKLRQEPEIQAVISDIEMPRLNGLEFLSRCRQIMGDELPVIMLTSRGSEKYRLLAKQLGATHYLTKPYLDKELLSILKDCLHSF